MAKQSLMKKKTIKILVVTSQQDVHTDIVLSHLSKLNVNFFRLNTDSFFEDYNYSFFYSNKGAIISIFNKKNFKQFDFYSGVAWYRKPQKTFFHRDQKFEKNSAEFISSETSNLFRFLYTNNNVKWVNNYYTNIKNSSKASQLILAKEIGFKIPDTLITNKISEFEDFYNKHDKSVIAKTLGTQIANIDQKGVFLHAHKISPNNVHKIINSFSVCPVIIQEYIPKKIELRIVVIGQKVFAVSIDSQNNFESKVDWRIKNLSKLDHKEYILPKEIEDKIGDLMKKQGLIFGAIDMIVTPDNEYVFLENNPNGQWYWLEILTGLPMAKTMAELLVNLS